LLADLVEPFYVLEGFAYPFHHRDPDVLRGVELGLLGQEADADTALGSRLAVDIGIEARHDLEKAGFTRTIEAQDANLGAREEREADVPKDDPLGRDHLGDSVH